jgi:hypothetical protein
MAGRNWSIAAKLLAEAGQFPSVFADFLSFSALAALSFQPFSAETYTGNRTAPPTLVRCPRGFPSAPRLTIEGLNRRAAPSTLASGVAGRILRVKELPDLPDRSARTARPPPSTSAAPRAIRSRSSWKWRPTPKSAP